MSNLWWHNIPQHKVGDLVKSKDGFYGEQVFIVVSAKPKKPCRVNPEQHIHLVRCSDGAELHWARSKRWVGVRI